MKTQILDYEDSGGKPLRGFLAWDEAVSGIRAAVLVIHENMGLTEHERERATQLVSLGYIALACDMFGERTTTPATDAERRATATAKSLVILTSTRHQRANRVSATRL